MTLFLEALSFRRSSELIFVDVSFIVMAYGAILRLCAARGLPERAIGLLEDMERFEVKPTTLCFTAALKSVARSHEISNRYQRGTSRRDMKRETITAHHGKMARQIVILAEASEVEQDDGFTSALMLCSAAAGDSATAKAILLASEARKLDHLRTIGGSRPHALDGLDDGLQLNSGITKDAGIFSDLIVMEGTLNKSSRNNKEIVTFGEREYGKDTRIISALVRSCAQALNKNGIGTMWAGRENLGYLCENSLRLITTRWEPSYRDNSVPGVSSTKVGVGALRHMDERETDYEYTPGKRKKFRGLFVDEDDIATIDDVRGDLDSGFHEDEEGAFDDDLFSDDEEEDFSLDDNKPTPNMLECPLGDQNDDGKKVSLFHILQDFTVFPCFKFRLLVCSNSVSCRFFLFAHGCLFIAFQPDVVNSYQQRKIRLRNISSQRFSKNSFPNSKTRRLKMAKNLI